jgi:D-alanyl-D-alanine carboxypeptidase/D-alanyl-D-alanine-endopeptidase (penicillin-binding protein 4)
VPRIDCPNSRVRETHALSARLGGWSAFACLALATACGHSAVQPAVSPAPAVMAPPPPVDPRVALRAAIDSMLGDPRFRSAFWGVLIVDPAHNDTLYNRNAEKLFLPASNMKVVTASVALAQLGPDFRFRTTFAAHGTVRDGVLHGDLVVIGRGDPTVSDHMMRDAMLPLRAAAESLAAHGIHRITGHIVGGDDAFPDANIGFGWDWDDLGEPYAAGVDELMFNEGYATVTLRGAAHSGGAAHVTTTPIPDYPLIRSRVTTATIAGGSAAVAPTAVFDAAHGDLVVNGTVAPGDTATLLVALRDPEAAYLYGLADALRARGVTLRPQPVIPTDDGKLFPNSGVVPVTTSPGGRIIPAAEDRRDTLFAMFSPPLRDILPALLKPSQNQIAEILLKTLGLEKTGVGSADSGRRVVASQLTAWGVPPDQFVIRDGSGLSRHDYLSPATLVRTLSTVEHDSAYQVFYDALPIAGIDGTISDRMRGTPAAGNVHAKTGFVDRARSLSGYVTTTDGVGLVFSLLCNNWTTPVHDVEHVQDEIAERLASMTLGAR